ncbi:MAG: hypothetical protein ACXU8S_14905 [Phenylobacterium sp.]
MSNLLSTPLRRRIAWFVALYAAAYLVCAELDLGTTTLALQQAGASEGNVYAKGAAGYAAARAWTINLVAGGLILAGLIASGLRAGDVAEAWLRRPIRSFGKFYVNPFARTLTDRGPLHVISFALAFLALRLLAAGNNLMIYRSGTGPLGWLIGVLTHHMAPSLAFWIVLAPLFYLLTFAISPVAARVVLWLRSAPGHGLPAPVDLRAA